MNRRFSPNHGIHLRRKPLLLLLFAPRLQLLVELRRPFPIGKHPMLLTRLVPHRHPRRIEVCAVLELI